MKFTASWQFFALASALFAAFTAIFGKLGVAEINSNLATFIRTIVILIVTALIVSLRDEWRAPTSISSRTIVFLVLSGIATGLSWLCYYRALQLGPVSLVAPVDKLSVALVVVLAFFCFRRDTQRADLDWRGAYCCGLVGDAFKIIFGEWK
jgi:bacterial/archaeal transporter family protein